VEVDEWGYFLSPELWGEEMAHGLAAHCGIPKLTERHWQVIRFARAHWEDAGTKPTVRLLGKTSGASVRELYQLFPNSPALTVAHIAGIPKMYLCHNPGPRRPVPAVPRRGRAPRTGPVPAELVAGATRGDR
jgi:tRNA 2-thiouridine synthesizing protein E